MSNILPENPGRERRLAYGNYIRNINRINNNRVRVNRIESNLFIEIPNDIIVIGNNFQGTFTNDVDRRQGRRIRVERASRISRSGLLLKDLYKNSDVYFRKEKILCSICLNDKTDNIIRKLVCNHFFHINCIEMWLSDNNNCPMCRYVF
jgi:hypothetical protein